MAENGNADAAQHNQIGHLAIRSVLLNQLADDIRTEQKLWNQTAIQNGCGEKC